MMENINGVFNIDLTENSLFCLPKFYAEILNKILDRFKSYLIQNQFVYHKDIE